MRRGVALYPLTPTIDQIDWIRGCSVVFPASFRGDLFNDSQFLLHSTTIARR